MYRSAIINHFCFFIFTRCLMLHPPTVVMQYNRFDIEVLDFSTVTGSAHSFPYSNATFGSKVLTSYEFQTFSNTANSALRK